MKPSKVDREPYTGPVVDLAKDIETDINSVTISPSSGASFHHRPLTKSGVRNLQDSSFALGGEQWDDQPVRGSRAKNPPGGKSSVVF